jgi:hypothetical protein
MMRKNGNASRVVLVAALAACLAACANPVWDQLVNQAMMGEWVNASYGASSFPRTTAMNIKAGGEFTYRDSMNALQPGTYTIAAEWAGDGGHYFEVLYVAGAAMNYYTLLHVSSDGLTYESNTGGMAYPTSISSSDMSYVIMSRP